MRWLIIGRARKDNMFQWDDKFQRLAVYNGEVSRGVVHTPEYCKAMSVLQSEYDARLKEAAEASAQPTTHKGVSFLQSLWNRFVGKNDSRL